MLNGYAGKMLFVDLTDGSMEEKEVTRELAEQFVGGYGFGAKILYDLMVPGADPLGPDNILGFVTGPATATRAFFGGRYTIVHKSPVTGGWNDANSGGYFGPELKKAGYDALFIKGISEAPVYLYINDGQAEIRDASHLWGQDAKEVWASLKEETGEPKVRVTAIGPAGENLSHISCPINDGHRAPGRGGGGAVMGSKRLKAIAVRGTMDVPVAFPEQVMEINKRVTEVMKQSSMAQAFSVFGTGAGTAASALSGDSPVKNWGGTGVTDYGTESAEKLAAASLDRHKTQKYACASCPLGCGARYSVKDGRWPMEDTERPEYETSASFGSTCLCDEEDAVLKCNELCNRYGFDTIAAGMTIAWAMECYEHGVLTRDDLDGIELTWGNGEAMVALLEKMGRAEGCGAIIGKGSAYAAKALGKGEGYLQTASGIELPMHDPRFAPGLARTYQYDPTPGRHVKGGAGLVQMIGGESNDKYDFNGTGPLDLAMTIDTELTNASGLCMFHAYAAPPETNKAFIRATTGFEFSDEAAQKAGERIYLLRQAFNVREGITPGDMTMSKRALGQPPLTEGPLEGVTIDDELLAKNFFETIGIDQATGKPSREKLKELGGLENVMADFYGKA